MPIRFDRQLEHEVKRLPHLHLGGFNRDRDHPRVTLERRRRRDARGFVSRHGQIHREVEIDADADPGIALLARDLPLHLERPRRRARVDLHRDAERDLALVVVVVEEPVLPVIALSDRLAMVLRCGFHHFPGALERTLHRPLGRRVRPVRAVDVPVGVDLELEDELDHVARLRGRGLGCRRDDLGPLFQLLVVILGIDREREQADEEKCGPNRHPCRISQYSFHNRRRVVFIPAPAPGIMRPEP